MSCKHHDCFTCPYDDCIEDSAIKTLRMKRDEGKEKKPKDRKAYFRDYYLAHREQMIENAKKNQAKYRSKLNNDKNVRH